MKLFLSSEALFGNLSKHFTSLVGKEASDIKVAIIENAADTYADENKQWVYDNRNSLIDAGYKHSLVDLRNYTHDNLKLEDTLSNHDAIWINGGNTFYLNWILHESGANNIIPRLVARGMVYGGGSAGTIVAGPTLRYIDKADDPKLAPKIIWDSMNMTKTVVVPHLDNPKYGGIMLDVIKNLNNDRYKTIGITDSQAVIFENDNAPRLVQV